MNASSLSLALIAAALVAGMGLTRCRVDDTLDDRAWPCVRVADCGSRDGNQLMCWRNYCMPTCIPVPDPDPRDFVCLETGESGAPDGVRLEKCTPYLENSFSPFPEEGRCAPGFSCYRTDLVLNEGVCVPFDVCSEDAQCPGEKRTFCASAILEELIADAVARRRGDADAGASAVFTDHLLCVDKTCRALDTGVVNDPGLQCPDGEECLGETYSLEGNDLPDICVPHCDSMRRCLPNFACATTDFATAANPLCVPGLPGVRCERDIDCIVGKCEDTGVGFRICTIGCDTDEQCADALNSGISVFRCGGSRADGSKVCLNTNPFHGVQCGADEDCSEETPECFAFSPAGDVHAKPECRMPCEDGRCPRRGGLGHVCLANGDGGCYPGEFGLPCQASSECVTPFDCLAVEPTGREVLSGSAICSIPCRTTADCDALSNLNGSGYCEGGVCRPAAPPGRPCDAPEQCLSDRCELGLCTMVERP